MKTVGNRWIASALALLMLLTMAACTGGSAKLKTLLTENDWLTENGGYVRFAEDGTYEVYTTVPEYNAVLQAYANIYRVSVTGTYRIRGEQIEMTNEKGSTVTAFYQQEGDCLAFKELVGTMPRRPHS